MPSYPAILRKGQIEGIVVVSMIIDTSGNVSEVKVVKSLHPALDSSAVTTVKQWKFSPARQDGTPVKTKMEIPVRFSLSK